MLAVITAHCRNDCFCGLEHHAQRSLQPICQRIIGGKRERFWIHPAWKSEKLADFGSDWYNSAGVRHGFRHIYDSYWANCNSQMAAAGNWRLEAASVRTMVKSGHAGNHSLMQAEAGARSAERMRNIPSEKYGVCADPARFDRSGDGSNGVLLGHEFDHLSLLAICIHTTDKEEIRYGMQLLHGSYNGFHGALFQSFSDNSIVGVGWSEVDHVL